jgi:phage N-6-adenine-methyltransferase
MNNALMFSKASDEWSTPQEFYDALDAEFEFDLDAAASHTHHMCPTYITAEDDSLAVDWIEWCNAEGPPPYGPRVPTVWLNPPYSKCREFFAKAKAECRKGCTVVMLVPARTDTRWFHDHVWDSVLHCPREGVEVRFIKGRLKFASATAGAPFPSMVVVFRP